MDPRSSVQDVYRCDLCEIEIVHSYCDFCHVNLCKPCVGEHISDGYDKHKIVPFQERRSTLIYPKCEMHTKKNCEFQCKDCNNIFVCSSCTASKQHKGHDFVDVIEVYKTKKKVIEKDIKELENQTSPTYEEIALDLKNQLANLDGGYKKLTTTISKQGELWHREIDIVINKIKSEINEIKVNHREILQIHLDEIKQIQSLMKQTLLALREIEKSTEVYHTLKYSSEISKSPPNVMVSMPTFIPKSIDREKLYILFGQITSLSTVRKENVLHLYQTKTRVRELLGEPVLLAKIQTAYKGLRSVTYFNEDKIWTIGDTIDIKCFNDKGLPLLTLKLKSEVLPNDLAVDSDGNVLYLDWKTRTVNTVKKENTEELIRFREWKPNKMCITSTGDLLFTMYSNDRTQSKVVRYSGCIEKQTIRYDNEYKPLYSGNASVKYITENRNHHICVADSWAGAVVVVNQDGKLIWRYTGRPSVTKNKPFSPYGIATDSQRHILTADCDNHCIHILDEKGEFLRYIGNCDLESPWGVCIDKNDSLFVCEFHRGNVKKVKYLK